MTYFDVTFIFTNQRSARDVSLLLACASCSTGRARFSNKIAVKNAICVVDMLCLPSVFAVPRPKDVFTQTFHVRAGGLTAKSSKKGSDTNILDNRFADSKPNLDKLDLRNDVESIGSAMKWNVKQLISLTCPLPLPSLTQTRLLCPTP